MNALSQYEPFNEKTASTEDKVAWALCQIIDRDAPVRWERFRGIGILIAKHPTLMDNLQKLSREPLRL